MDASTPSTPLAALLAIAERHAPIELRRFVAQARRDVSTLESALLLGRRPPPLVVRPPRREARPSPVEATRFVAEAKPSVVATVRSYGLTVLDGDVSHSLRAKDEQFLLEAVLESGATVPFSCTLGGCGSCKVKLESGGISLEEPNCLTPEELDAGYRLLCVGRATADCVVRVERED